MNIAQILLTVMLYGFFFTYLIWGIYIWNQNPKEKINRIFTILCFSLALWSMGYATANIQPTINQVLLWRRISAIGWTSVYSLMLHFLLVLTPNKKKTLTPFWEYILYLPATFSMIIYSFSDYFANIQYEFVEIWYGWLSLSMNTIWSYIFMFTLDYMQ